MVVLKGLAEVAGLALLGQGVLYLLAGGQRDQNVFYRVLATVTRPVRRLTRLITPRAIPDRYLGVLAFALVLGLWVALTLLKIGLVLEARG